MTKIYNISAALPFADNLALGILEKYGNSPLALNDIILLLPSRRSCRSLQEAFLRITGGKPTILPKMQPLGDVGDEEFTFKLSLGGIDMNLPPVLSPTSQRLLLAKLIEKFQGGYVGKNKITTAQSTHLATQLAAFLDEVQRQQLPFSKLYEIVPDELARHWQITLDFMEIIIKDWPEILAERNVLDIGTYRNISLQRLAEYWQDNPPINPVIAAGSTGSIPATANLLKIIAKLPNGAVVLPGVDQIMDDDSWKNIAETHPQTGLKHLLDNLGVGRGEVQDWSAQRESYSEQHGEIIACAEPPLNSINHKTSSREKLLSQIMLPATSYDKWRSMEGINDDAIAGISRIDAPTLHDEARVIAMMFRETLEIKGKTAALITNDQNLAARVMGIIGKWGITLDNSGGKPLCEVVPCVFMRLIIRMVQERMSPISLLACLKHPMARFGMKAIAFKNIVRQIESEVLRGIRIDGGIEAIQNALEEKGKENLANWLGAIEKTFRPFLQVMQSKSASLQRIITEHIKVAVKLAQTDEISGEEHLWGRDDGDAVHEFFEEILEASNGLGEIDPAQYYGILEALLVGRNYHPKYGSHPRLSILSPIEARMQSFDLCILGGMNEGTWPPFIESGPWMSRPMRQSFGLPSPERKIGQSAHDFVQACHAPNIVLTRSKKVDGAAAIPSRWLMRLDAVLDICGNKNSINPKTPWLKLAHMLESPDSKTSPCMPPEPMPPKEARPLEMSVTSVKNLMCDPYSYYASKILRLRNLDQIDMEPSNREFGNIAHKVIEQFVTGYNNIPPVARLDFMLDNWNCLLKKNHIPGAMQAFWQPRFKTIAEELIREELLIRPENKVLGEVHGEYKIVLEDGRGFTITARADRIQQNLDGKITIIDYKSSEVQSIAKGVLNGALPQLPLEALIANHNGFEGLSCGSVEELEYWVLKGKNDALPAITQDKISMKLNNSKPPLYKSNLPELLEITAHGINQLVNVFSKASIAYRSCPDPEKIPNFNEFEHLARRKEWL